GCIAEDLAMLLPAAIRKARAVKSA
ncbi:MAG: hypothetical protein JWO26_2719, partial [Rhodospirillales bacterium]|nr:hypothetical protein [Rhodospirillales bacterium]